MASTIYYLLKNRERPKTLARLVKVLAKRVISFPALCMLLVRPIILRVLGAKIGALAVVGQAKINGRLNLLSIGEQCSLGRCEIAVFAPVVIGSRVVINDGARLLTASHKVEGVGWERVERPIIVDDYAWIATGATILPGVHIGRGAVVGAGAVVSKSVPAGSVCCGNPGVILGKQRPSELAYDPTALLAPFEAWLGSSPLSGIRNADPTARS